PGRGSLPLGRPAGTAPPPAGPGEAASGPGRGRGGAPVGAGLGAPPGPAHLDRQRCWARGRPAGGDAPGAGRARRRVRLARRRGRPPGLLTLTVIDVGQGDALLVETPRGRRVLIDGGGWPAFGAAPARDVGERVILPFLRAERIGRLDLVVSTHPDGDHTLGLRAVLERMPVGLLVHNGWIGPGTAVDLLGPWRAEADRLVWQGPGRPRALPHVALHAGDRILLEPGVSLTVLHPPREGFPRDGNDGSLVLLLEGRGVRFL